MNNFENKLKIVQDETKDKLNNLQTEISDSLNNFRREIDEFNNLKNTINDQFNRLQKSIQKQIDKQSFSTSNFINTSQKILDSFAHDFGNLNDKTEKELYKYKSDIELTKDMLENHINVFNKKYTLIITGLIITSSISITAIILNLIK